MNHIQKRLMSASVEYIAKKRKIAADLVKKRLEDQKLRKHQPINSASIQVLGDGTQGTKPSLLVNSDGKSYLFNCNSGLQRACFTNRVRLTGLEHIFLTHLSTDTISGIYGLSLTASDIGLPSIKLHSNKSAKGLFNSMLSFTQGNNSMSYDEDLGSTHTFEDLSLQVMSIIINRHQTDNGSRSEDTCPLMAYVCRLPGVAGALDPVKCREMKVPVGPLLARLKSGQDITLHDGTIVRSSDVCQPAQPGAKFLIVECPSKHHIDSFIACDQLNKVIEDSDKQNEKFGCVFHMTPPDIVKDKRYSNWLDKFRDGGIKHFIVSHEYSDRIHLVDFMRNLHMLNQLDDQIFLAPQFEPKLQELIEADSKLEKTGPIKRIPLSYELNNQGEQKDISYTTIEDLKSLDRIHNLYNLDKLVLKPRSHLDILDDKLDLNATYREVSGFDGFDTALENLKNEQKKFPESQYHEPEVVFLGTGSAIPSKYRNTTGILINFPYPVPRSVILDCGEDTYGQLIRLYGDDKTRDILRNLKFIYVSHFHADHHVGLTQLIDKRSEVTEEPISLLLPPGVISLLEYHNNNIKDLSKTYRLYQSRTMKTFKKATQDSLLTARMIKSNLYEYSSGFIDNIDILEVDHCAHACAIVITFKLGHPKLDTFTLSYSGDCRPSDTFAEYGKDCDLLIHEATFDDRNQEDANAKKHCTISEAIGISRKMSAKYTILTHFSQRLVKIPIFTDEFDEKIGFGFDGLRIKCPSHYGRMSLLKPILNIVYRESIESMETKFARDQQKKLISDSLLSKTNMAHGL